MLKLEHADGKVCPFIYCDFCQTRIESHGHFGTAYLPPKFRQMLNSGRLWYVHDRCRDDFEGARNPKLFWAWDELDLLPIFLGQNLQVNWDEAKERAFFAAGYADAAPLFKKRNPTAKQPVPPVERIRREMSPTLRFEILKRDGYRCRMCGRGADDGMRLHVDHKVPVSKGGTNERVNLQTLCLECNLGKHAKEL